LWENGYGIVMPPEIDPAALPAARATLEMIARFDVRVVIPGHGEPFTDVRAALDRASQPTDALEADALRNVRHVLKSLLMFTLLDKRGMALADLPAYLDRVEGPSGLQFAFLSRFGASACRTPDGRART
jgi:hypothetical protein